MEVIATDIDGVFVLTPKRFGDDRGWFAESYNPKKLPGAMAGLSFVQDNQSFSAPAYTVRGMHYQAPPHAQDKLVQCLSGAVLDVAVDIREGSETFGRHVAVELSAESGNQLLVPKGFLHGFMTLRADTLVCYKVTDFYYPELDGTVAWSSESLGIDWPAPAHKVTLSRKDGDAPDFSVFRSPFRFGD